MNIVDDIKRYRLMLESVDKQAIDKLFRGNFTNGTDNGTDDSTDDGFDRLDYSIDTNGFITIYSELSILYSRQQFHQFPVKFVKTFGGFICDGIGLKTLEGSPQQVNFFHCNNNILTSLEGGPLKITGSFYCENNKLTSLKGAPSYIGAWLGAAENPLTSLEGLPEKLGKGIILTWNPQLPLLRLLKVRQFTLRMPGSETKQQRQVTTILRKYQAKDVSRNNIIACQKELIDNGFEGNAGW